MLILVDNLVSSNNEVAMHPEDKETDDQAVVVDDLAIDDGRNMIFFRWIKEAYAYMDNDTTCST